MIGSIVVLVLLLAMVGILLVQSKELREIKNRITVQKDITAEILGHVMTPEEVETTLKGLNEKYKAEKAK